MVDEPSYIPFICSINHYFLTDLEQLQHKSFSWLREIERQEETICGDKTETISTHIAILPYSAIPCFSQVCNATSHLFPSVFKNLKYNSISQQSTLLSSQIDQTQYHKWVCLRTISPSWIFLLAKRPHPCIPDRPKQTRSISVLCRVKHTC